MWRGWPPADAVGEGSSGGFSRGDDPDVTVHVLVIAIDQAATARPRDYDARIRTNGSDPSSQQPDNRGLSSANDFLLDLPAYRVHSECVDIFPEQFKRRPRRTRGMTKMEYRLLGDTGLRVGVHPIGPAKFGPWVMPKNERVAPSSLIRLMAA
jgi:hypothetical protein